MKKREYCLAYFVKVSLNIVLTLSICATLALSCFLLLSSACIVAFSLFISAVLADNQVFFVNNSTRTNLTSNNSDCLVRRSEVFSNFKLAFYFGRRALLTLELLLDNRHFHCQTGV
jgi:hypothetical protein